MWFYPLLLFLVVLGLVGIIFLGGVYTLVLVPLAVIGLISAVGYAMWGRAQAAGAGGATEATHTTTRPLPGRGRRQRGREPTSAERLAEGRRQSARTPEQ